MTKLISTESRSDKIRTAVSESRVRLKSSEILSAAKTIDGLQPHIDRLSARLDQIEKSLNNIPTIQVAFLGPSRHGKSTLLNSLTQNTLLPTSDDQPCTASIIKLNWAESWNVKVRLVTLESLKADFNNAIKEAVTYLDQLDHKNEQPDNPAFLTNTLHRFIELYKIDKELPPRELVQACVSTTIKLPRDVVENLGKHIEVKTDSLEKTKDEIEKYLSTKGNYWTIVDECEISGPFEDWHPNLCLVDIPGTNDTNPHRTKITNQLRETSKAVAITTTDSNLGFDMQSWLQNSSVLKDFFESKEGDRQRLIVIRTKTDSYHAEISDEELQGATEEEIETLEKAAFNDYVSRQTASYIKMLREISLPLLPIKETDENLATKRQELLDRLDSVPAFFVSAFAYEVFEGRKQVTPRKRRNLEETFYGDLSLTGVDHLRASLNDLAKDYLENNYYDDIEAELEREVSLLASYFRREMSLVKANLSGSKEHSQLAVHIRSEIAPWVDRQTKANSVALRAEAKHGTNSINARLEMAQKLAGRRLKDKLEIWKGYAWNSLRATARKGGTHTKSDGTYIDIMEDVCEVLIGDVLLAWTSFRDETLESKTKESTDMLVRGLIDLLHKQALATDNIDATEAANDLIQHLKALCKSDKAKMISEIDRTISRYQSIRKPLQKYISDQLTPVFDKISSEAGTGCAARMRSHLETGFSSRIPLFCKFISDKISEQSESLIDACDYSMQQLGQNTHQALISSADAIEKSQRNKDRKITQAKLTCIQNAMPLLPSPSTLN